MTREEQANRLLKLEQEKPLLELTDEELTALYATTFSGFEKLESRLNDISGEKNRRKLLKLEQEKP